MGNMNLQDHDYSNEDSVEEVISDDSEPVDNDKELKADESSDDVNRRKKIRRLLELQLERKRLRKEIDFFAELDDEEDYLEEDENL